MGAVTTPDDSELGLDRPTSARMYDYCLGGKDNFEVDREASKAMFERFPEGLLQPRDNRRFLYRVVRFLARDAGIKQFLDLGSGLPTQNNVHQVAGEFQPGARVVYVDHDPIVLAHGRALLAEDRSTTVISADMVDTDEILNHAETRRLIDFSEPVAVLFLSVTHSIVDDEVVRRMLATIRAAVVPGSHIALSQLVGESREVVDEANAIMAAQGVAWKNRMREDVAAFVADLEPVEPGLVDVKDWRPDPTQPPLPPVEESLQKYIELAKQTRFSQCGGVFRVP
ncbi:SAM-dependent methyltransferase [Actinomadura adrarensis]|uniref:SAM-dependent methyltransferase n=1 Tax=Actinomadura adrarensis TaxID=1819600 RepID=A0ABW3CQV9_9ACTN